MQIWAYPNYRDSDIVTIAIAIVIYYRDISHYRYYHSALQFTQLNFPQFSKDLSVYSTNVAATFLATIESFRYVLKGIQLGLE